MAIERKIKIVWLAFVSNQNIRKHLAFDNNTLERLARKLTRRPKAKQADICQWITNGLAEYENNDEIELHCIAPHLGIKGVQAFEMNGICYHFFRSEDDYPFFKRLFHKPKKCSMYVTNRGIIKGLIDEIKPDIVHIFGAENPQYSLAALDIDTNSLPLIVSLQTLMTAPGFKDNYPISDCLYSYRSGCEQEVLKHTHYIGSKSNMFKKLVWESINPNAIFLNSTLFLGEAINRTETEKIYDIIYYARDISKAFDIALKVLIEVVKYKPSVTMCVVGGCNSEHLLSFNSMIHQMGIEPNVVYLGVLPTHKDVLDVLRSAKVALLPVKVEGITGTMREALSNGVPVVTTKTWGTPVLNEKRNSAFIEDINDYEAMAKDVIKLIEDNQVYNDLRENGFLTSAERYSNEAFAKIQTEIYRALVDYKEKGVPIPERLCTYNTLLNVN